MRDFGRLNIFVGMFLFFKLNYLAETWLVFPVNSIEVGNRFFLQV